MWSEWHRELRIETTQFFVWLPRRLSDKESACQCKRGRFSPWVGEILWRKKWQPTPVFLPGKSHGQRNLAACSPRGGKESDTTEQPSTHAHSSSYSCEQELPGVIKTWGWNSDVAELKASGAKAFRSRTSEEQFFWCCSGICFLRPTPEILLQDLLPLFSSAQAIPQDCTAAQNTSSGNQCPRLRSDLFGNHSFSSVIPYSSQIVL